MKAKAQKEIELAQENLDKNDTYENRYKLSMAESKLSSMCFRERLVKEFNRVRQETSEAYRKLQEHDTKGNLNSYLKLKDERNSFKNSLDAFYNKG